MTLRCRWLVLLLAAAPGSRRPPLGRGGHLRGAPGHRAAGHRSRPAAGAGRRPVRRCCSAPAPSATTCPAPAATPREEWADGAHPHGDPDESDRASTAACSGRWPCRMRGSGRRCMPTWIRYALRPLPPRAAGLPTEAPSACTATPVGDCHAAPDPRAYAGGGLAGAAGAHGWPPRDHGPAPHDGRATHRGGTLQRPGAGRPGGGGFRPSGRGPAPAGDRRRAPPTRWAAWRAWRPSSALAGLGRLALAAGAGHAGARAPAEAGMSGGRVPLCLGAGSSSPCWSPSPPATAGCTGASPAPATASIRACGRPTRCRASGTRCASMSRPRASMSGRFEGPQCIQCHEAITPGIVADWRASRHATLKDRQAGRTAPDCHGTDHQRLRLPTPEVCGGCHAKQHGEFQDEAATASPAMCWPWSGRWTPSTSSTSPRPR